METAQEYYSLGYSHEKSDPEKAIEYYEKATQINPQYVEAYLDWGNLLLNQGKPDEAKEKYEKCLELDPNYKLAYHNLGYLMERSEPEVAIDYYNKAIALDPYYFEAYNSLGSVLLNSQKYEEAKKYFKKSLEIAPNYKWAHFNLGRIFEKTDYIKAIASYKKAIDIDINYLEAYYAIAGIWSDQKNYEEAINWYEKCLEIDPGYKWAHYNLGVCFENNNTKKAIEYYQKAIDLDPQFTDVYNRWGNLLLGEEQYEEAKEKYEKCIEIDSKFKWAYYNLGVLNERVMDTKSAIKHYKKAIHIDPEYQAAYDSLAELLLNRSTVLQARREYSKWTKTTTGKKIGYYYLGRTYEKTEPEKSITYFEKSITEDNNFVAGYNSWGNVLLSLGKSDEAGEKYLKCIQLDPDYKWAYYNLGIVSKNKNDYEKAIQYYQKAIKIDSTYEVAYLNWGDILLDQEDKEKAQAEFEEWSNTDAIKKIGYYFLGRLSKKDDPDKAIAYYEKARKADPKFVELYNVWGNVLLDKGMLKEAREKYNKCLEIDPNFHLAYSNLGFSFRHEDPQKAITCYQKIIHKKNDDVNAYNDIYHCITLLKDYKEEVKNFHDLVDKYKSVYGFWALGNLYQYFLKDYAQSLFYYEKATLYGEVKDGFLDLSNLYDSIGNLQKSVEVLDEVLEENNYNNVYALHNKAHYLFKKGGYQNSRKLWQEVLQFYEKQLKENLIFRKDPNNYLYCGNIYFEFFGDLDKAEHLFEEGVRRDNKNTSLLFALNQLYAEKDKREVNAELSNYWKRNANLKAAEKIINKPYNFANDYFKMAELYALEGENEKGHEAINEYLSYGEPSAKGFNLQGQLYLAQEEYLKAIRSFKKAVKLDEHNFLLSNNLGNAYLRNKEYSAARNEFDKVLRRDPNNVDALIGLSELNLNGPDEELNEKVLSETDKYLKDAIQIGKSGKGSKQLNLYENRNFGTKEKKYKDLKLSDLYYSRGYIKTKQYEKNKLEINNSYLKDSLQCFKKSLDSNPDNIKAKTAIEEINTFIKSKRDTNINERSRALLVCSMAFVLFAFCQYYFYFLPKSTDSYALDEKGIAYLSETFSLKEEGVAGIKSITGVPFNDKTALVTEIQKLVAKDQKVNMIKVLEKMDFKMPDSGTSTSILSAGYYALISFGSILFMIAGLYLRKLLKIKVGVIELEKNKPSEISDMSLSGIEK